MGLLDRIERRLDAFELLLREMNGSLERIVRLLEDEQKDRMDERRRVRDQLRQDLKDFYTVSCTGGCSCQGEDK